MSLDRFTASRGLFPALRRELHGKPLAYFDGPGGTQVPQPVIEAVSDYYSRCNANTHGQFVTSLESDQVLQETREALAALLGAPSWREISLGANMTTLSFSLSRALGRSLKPEDEVVITQLDHEANRGPWLSLAERGAVVKEVALRPDGTLDYEDMVRKITPRTRLVAIGYSSNALGTVNDLALARKLSKEVGAWLIVDAVHAAPHFPIDVVALDADFLLCSAYKFYGPHVGVLCSRPGLLDQLHPDRLRTQDPEAPFRIETGTLNHAAIAGVRAAVHFLASFSEGATLRERIVRTMTDLSTREHTLAKSYFDRVSALPGVTVWGQNFSNRHRAPTVSITLKGHHPEAIAKRLGEQGVLVWDGNFYAARAIEVLGLEEQGGVVRSGISLYTTEEEVQRLLDGIAAIAKG
jgi:cysteine desulfurase family protein (TIGR01976 family)